MTIGPWTILLIYDLLLYIWRTVTYEVPGIGGRARGKHRPRAPSLSQRPSGNPRRFSIGRRPSPDGNPAVPSAAGMESSKHENQRTVHAGSTTSADQSARDVQVPRISKFSEDL